MHSYVTRNNSNPPQDKKEIRIKSLTLNTIFFTNKFRNIDSASRIKNNENRNGNNRLKPNQNVNNLYYYYTGNT